MSADLKIYVDLVISIFSGKLCLGPLVIGLLLIFF
jgi:hypothetical protein